MHQQLWGYEVEEKIYLGVRERKKVYYHWSLNMSVPACAGPRKYSFK